MRRGAISLLLYAVLVFQLAFGLPALPVHAASVSQQMTVRALDAAHCPLHSSTRSLSGHTAPTTGAALHPQPTLGTHDCCRSGCHCHCAFTPGIAGLTGWRIRVASGYFLPTSDERVDTERPDFFFRPPIA